MRAFITTIIAGFIAVGAASAGDFSINIDGINSADGTIRVALHNGADGFPFDREPIAKMEVPSAVGTVVVQFGRLAPGAYAISLFHDENGNTMLDRNLLGIPKEGYGFSNNARSAFGPPRFAAARFTVDETAMVINVEMGY